MTKNKQFGIIKWIFAAVAAILFAHVSIQASAPFSMTHSSSLQNKEMELNLRILNVCRVQQQFAANILADVPMLVEKAACLGDTGETCHYWCFDGNQTK